MSHWVWVFGEIEGLRSVLASGEMGFRLSASERVHQMSTGDRAVLYESRGAFHNPTRDRSRLRGTTTVVGAPRQGDPLEILGVRFELFVPFEVDVLLPERSGPEFKDLVPEMEFIRKKDAWGAYLRPNPIRVAPADFGLMSEAVTKWLD